MSEWKIYKGTDEQIAATDAGMRGGGHTTKQILDAPEEAIYVWVNERIYYPKKIANKLGRNDLIIKGPSVLEYGRLRGINKPIILDHAVSLTSRQADGYAEYVKMKR